MRVVVFTKTSPIGPSSRYRYYQYAARLHRLGVDLECRPLFGPAYFRLTRVTPRWLRIVLKCLYVPLRFLARLGQLARVGQPNLIVVEHQLLPYLPAFGERWLSRRGSRWTLEFDDAIYLTKLHRQKMANLCRLASHVVVGNPTLARFAALYNSAVSVVPTTIPLERYPIRDRACRERAPLVIGWIGLPYNFDALQILEEPIRRLADEFPIVLRVVSAGRPPLWDVPLESVEWSHDQEVSIIEDFDIGVMPLLDDEWSAGKCGLKVLQYFAARVPVVASPVGVNRDIVDDGHNGYLAATADEWFDRLQRLLGDPDLRREMGARGRAKVERDYAADVWAERLATLWRGVAGEEDARS